MSDFYVYLQVPEYLAQWIEHTFGSPVNIDMSSPENRVLNEFLIKTPAGHKPDTGEGANVIIPIPYFKGKDPRTYNHITRKGKAALAESFRTLLERNIWAEINPLEETANCKLSTLIYAWMEKHGIDEKYWDTISQIYYRRRKSLFKKNGIKT